jgi:RNA polymerase sigma factor (sigma-70 family)
VEIMGIEGREVATGEEPDLAGLLRRVRPVLEAILRRQGIPPEDAEDLMQQALLQFLRKRSQIRAPETWLPGAVRNECLMYWRGRSRRRTVAVDQAVLDLVADDGVEPEREVLRRGLGRWVAKLPWKCRSLLRMRYGLGLDVGDVAERMGYSPGSVDKVTRRCVEQLSRKMASVASRRLSP